MSLGVHRLLIWDRHYACRLDRQWTPPSDPNPTPDGHPLSKWTCTKPDLLSSSDSMQLIMGMTYSLKNMLGKLSPEHHVMDGGRASISASRKSSLAASPVDEALPSDDLLSSLMTSKETSFTYLCSKYRLLYYETGTGWKFVMLVDPTNTGPSSDLDQLLRQFYATTFLSAVIQNPSYRMAEADLARPALLSKIDEFIGSSKLLKLIS